ncbi:helix-turn-helix domain-containing protein [Chitinilyticum litopenaei]|uniref:helix-turn-helix domain-containing protein n=1 Tax=Chitinilyticum litopenaei TaxID=1121276 RepID=UPI0004205F9C|nr:helix-turn-helix domain-containing protein [Chitinilyticum litopenaei]
MQKEKRHPVSQSSASNQPGQITATEAAAQRLRVLAALRSGSCTTFELRDRCNVMMPAARIKELKDAGHTIITDLIDAEDSHGRPHGRVAKYTLIREAKA